MDKEFDGYPTIHQNDVDWLIERLGSLAGGSDNLQSVTRHVQGLDVDISFVVASASEHTFTAAVCEQLQREFGLRLGGELQPVIYVQRNPHPKAEECLDYAMRAA